ncbi:MAG: flagellin [Verrucomicrobia bacterium]|nr:MAG: flagellin [Verrucomicrobiota bacterium]
MAVVINSNPAAAYAAANLLKSNNLLQKSLSRLSSGSRISEPADDAGGNAVSMKLAAEIKRTEAVAINLSNALSFLQTQGGVMKSASATLDRLSELAVLTGDVTKSPADLSNYSVEFDNLFAELGKLSSDSFNSINLFTEPKTDLTVHLSQDGSQSMKISQSSLVGAVSAVNSIAAVSGANMSIVTDAMQSLATMMADNGAQASRLQFALDSLGVNRVSLEAANSRIYDVDVATETTKLARANLLVQSGASMLSQANTVSQLALKLLQ